MFQLNWDRAYKFYSLQESKLECGSVKKNQMIRLLQMEILSFDVVIWTIIWKFISGILPAVIDVDFFHCLGWKKDPQLLISTTSMQPVKFSNDPET